MAKGLFSVEAALGGGDVERGEGDGDGECWRLSCFVDIGVSSRDGASTGEDSAGMSLASMVSYSEARRSDNTSMKRKTTACIFFCGFF